MKALFLVLFLMGCDYFKKPDVYPTFQEMKEQYLKCVMMGGEWTPEDLRKDENGYSYGRPPYCVNKYQEKECEKEGGRIAVKFDLRYCQKQCEQQIYISGAIYKADCSYKLENK